MIDGIRPQLNYGDSTARKSGKVEAASVTSSGVEQDTVELTSLSSASTASSSASAPIDKAKIAAIRTAISNNAYPIDFQ
jgi:anti-sigma28 factor (negative regulator of flagellin synthesis)